MKQMLVLSSRSLWTSRMIILGSCEFLSVLFYHQAHLYSFLCFLFIASPPFIIVEYVATHLQLLTHPKVSSTKVYEDLSISFSTRGSCPLHS